MNRSISIQSLARINLLQFHKRTKSTQINNTKKVKLSIVDISPVTEGSTRGEAINNTLQLAQLADSLGYERYWLAEHHMLHMAAGRTPEVMIPHIANHTKRMRVGSGGVLLNYYSPYKVAESFLTLSELFPGRIDLGIGRANTTPLVDFALQKNRDTRDSDIPPENNIGELSSWIYNSFPTKHPFSTIPLPTDKGNGLEFWLLGSSHYRAKTAAQFGLPFCYAAFINQESTPEAINQYRQHFTANSNAKVSKPEFMLAVHVVCADTQDEARRLLAPFAENLVKLKSGKLNPFTLLATPEKAIAQLGGLPEVNLSTPTGVPPKFIAGTPQQVKEVIMRLANELDIDSFMIQDLIPDIKARLHSYKLLADVFGLEKYN